MYRLHGYKILITLVVMSLLLVSSIGFPHFGMDMEQGGQMSGCPFMGMTAICQMSPIEHIAAWQNMFTSLPFQNSVLLLLLSLLAFFLVLTWIEKIPIRPVSTQTIRYTQRAYISLRNPLQELFSSGILNPKLF